MDFFDKLKRVNPEKKYAEALECLRLNKDTAAANAAGIAAGAGYAPAMTLYSHLLRDGTGTARNTAEAGKWLKAAADSGEPQGMYEYAMSQPEPPLNLIERAAQGGYQPAMAVLGERYFRGNGIEQDSRQAADWLLRSVENGCRVGMKALAEMYREGIAVEQNDETALKYYELYLEKYPNDKAALNSALALKIDLGKLTPEEYYKLALELTDVGGAVKRSPRSINWTDAARYAKIAADLGLAKAQTLYAGYLFEGKGVEADTAQAVQYLTKAAENDDTPAMERLGLMYYSGGIVEKNLPEALSWLTKAAEEKSGAAMSALGRMYLFGEGVAPDSDRAFDLFFAASEESDPQSYYYIGYMFYNGICRPANPQSAEKWLIKAVRYRNSPCYNDTMELIKKLHEQ